LRSWLQAHLSETSKPKEVTRLDDFFGMVAGMRFPNAIAGFCACLLENALQTEEDNPK